MPGLVVFRGVRVGYRQGGRAGPILEDVSLEVDAEQTVAVVGQRWEGKTTLLRLAAGMELAEDGQVLLSGQDLATYTRQARATTRPRRRLARPQPTRTRTEHPRLHRPTTGHGLARPTPRPSQTHRHQG